MRVLITASDGTITLDETKDVTALQPNKADTIAFDVPAPGLDANLTYDFNIWADATNLYNENNNYYYFSTSF